MSGSSIESFKFFGMRVSFRNAKIFAAAEREAKSGARERKPLERGHAGNEGIQERAHLILTLDSAVNGQLVDLLRELDSRLKI